jgi:putative transposase
MAWVDKFVVWYDDEHRHSGIRYVTPSERYKVLDAKILKHRKLVYLEAKNKQTQRWSKDIREGALIDKVGQNPEVKSLAT